MKHLREALIGAEWFTNEFIQTGEVWNDGGTNDFCVCIEYSGTNYCFRLEAKDIACEGESEREIIQRLRMQLIELCDEKSLRNTVMMSILL